MKKIISIIITSIMIFSTFSAISLSAFALTTETVNLDNAIFYDQENWVADTQWHPTTMTKTNGLLTFKANNATDISVIDAHIGYKGKTYLDETLKVTAKIDNTITWFTMMLRSSNATNNIFNGDKYMIYFSGQGVSLMRINGNATADLGSRTFASPIDFTTENSYSLSAVNDTVNNKVIITVQINDIAAVVFEDASASRITAAGYFGAGMYESNINRTMTLGKTVSVTVPSDLAVQDIDKLVDDTENWISNDPASVKKQNGFITAKGLGEIAFSNNNAKFADANIMLTAKMNFTSDTSWIGLVIRAKLAGTQPYIPANECYFFAVSKTTVTLYRQNLNKDLVLLKTQPCTEFADGKAHTANLISYNGPDGVVLIFKTDGVEKLSYIDISGDKISASGFFTGFAYTNNELIIGKGMNLPSAPTIEVSGMTAQESKWVANSIGSISTTPTEFTVQGNESVAGYSARKFGDITFKFDFKAKFINDDWVAIGFRGKIANAQAWHQDNQEYLMIIRNNSISILKYISSKNIKDQYIATVPLSVPVGSGYHKMELTTVNVSDGVRILLKYDGDYIIDYLDKVNFIGEAGYFSLMGFSGNAITLKADPAMTESVNEAENPTTTDDTDLPIWIAIFGLALMIFITIKSRKYKHSRQLAR